MHGEYVNLIKKIINKKILTEGLKDLDINISSDDAKKILNNDVETDLPRLKDAFRQIFEKAFAIPVRFSDTAFLKAIQQIFDESYTQVTGLLSDEDKKKMIENEKAFKSNFFNALAQILTGEGAIIEVPNGKEDFVGTLIKNIAA